jgi:hypothetical protein
LEIKLERSTARALSVLHYLVDEKNLRAGTGVAIVTEIISRRLQLTREGLS